MTTHKVQPSLARMLAFALDNEMPEKIEAWKATLAEGEVTDEMIATFHGFGWLSSKRDPRIDLSEAATEPETPPATTLTTGGEQSPTGDVTTKRLGGTSGTKPPPAPPARQGLTG